MAVELRPPVPRPSKILCLGLNYAAHAREGGHEVPEHPTVFVRVATSLVAPRAPVVRPRVSEQLDYEAELAIVIGRRCHDVAEDQALALRLHDHERRLGARLPAAYLAMAAGQELRRSRWARRS